MRLTSLVAGAAASMSCVPCAADEPLQNHFGDPYFAISRTIAGCPQPAGPYVTMAERKVQSHVRAEKGTTCWLAGQCEKPNAFLYDADIAADLQRRIAERHPLPDSTLWLTVQARTVYMEGCVRDAGAASKLEAWARATPHVQQAVAIVFVASANARAPYRQMKAR